MNDNSPKQPLLLKNKITPKLSMKISSGGFNKFLKEGGGVDYRLDEQCWSPLRAGVIFELVEETNPKNRYCVRIIQLYKAKSFSALLKQLPTTLFDTTETEAYLNFFSKWWSKKDEEREGTLALHIEVID